MIPVFRLTADGRDITQAIQDRLLSISFRDEAESKSDRLTVELDDRPRRSDGAYLAFPNIGARLDFAIGYAGSGAIEMGSFTVDEITYSGPPATLQIAARAAGMAGPYRSAVSRSWHDTTLGDIAGAIAAEHGLTLAADPVVAATFISHADQTAESPMAFLARLAGIYDAVAKPVSGNLVLAPKGTGRTVSGRALPVLRLHPSDVTSWTYSYSARDEAGAANKDGGAGAPTAGGVRTVFWDKDEAKMKEVLGGNPPYEDVKFVSSDHDTARATANTVKSGKDRSRGKFSCQLPGNPQAMAEQLLELSGFRPGVPDGWRVTSVEHKLDSGGYTTSIDAERDAAGNDA